MFRKLTGWWFYLIFGLLFAAAYWIPAGSQNPTAIPLLILMVVFGLMGPPVLARDIKRVHPFVWLAAGLLILALLFVPTYLEVEYFPYNLPAWLKPVARATIFLAPSLALITAALLVYTGIMRLPGRDSHPPAPGAALPSPGNTRSAGSGWIAASAWVLAAALVARTLYNFYWLIVWDSTYDPVYILWLILPIYTALFSAAVLIIALPRRRKLAGLYGLVMPALLIAVTLLAKQVDFRQLTEARAGQVSQAIEAYYERQGHYPQTLRQLIPRDILSIPSPVIINGQTWCYESSGEQVSGSAAYYRLGYLDREDWSSPILYGRVYSAKGHSPQRVDVCQPAINTYRAQHPGWDRTLQEYGKPTPTPDIGK